MASAQWAAKLQKKIQEVMQMTGAADTPCPSCQGKKNVAMPFVTAPWASPPGEPFTPEGLLLVPVMCATCMHVRFFGLGGLANVHKKNRQGDKK